MHIRFDGKALRRGDNLQDLDVDERVILKGILRSGVERRESDSPGSRHGEVAGCFEEGSAPSCSINSRKYLDYLSQY